MSHRVALASVRDQIAFASGAGTIVKVCRAMVDDGWCSGPVVAYSDSLVTIATIGDQMDYDGFETVLIEDISDLELPHPSAEFFEEAFRLAGKERPLFPQDVDLSSFQSLLSSLTGKVSTVTLHRELDDPELCFIGTIESVTPSHISIFELTPDAEFDYTPTPFELEEITRVDFGGCYESALLAVAQNRGFHLPDS